MINRLRWPHKQTSFSRSVGYYLLVIDLCGDFYHAPFTLFTTPFIFRMHIIVLFLSIFGMCHLSLTRCRSFVHSAIYSLAFQQVLEANISFVSSPGLL